MRFPKPKGQEERAVLNSALEKIREEWGIAPGFGLPELLRHWQKFVQEVEEGYQLSIHDFTFDLSMRDLIEDIQKAVPLRLRAEIEAVIQPWDEQFRLATQPSTRPIEAGVDETSKEWWFRIPKHAGPGVERYLLENGSRNRTR